MRSRRADTRANKFAVRGISFSIAQPVGLSTANEQLLWQDHAFCYNERMSKRRLRTRAAEILTTSFLIALFILIGVAGMLWGLQSGALSGPTPTPTATPRPAPTATADFRATLISEDMLTQVAYSVVLATKAAEMVAAMTPLPTIVPTTPTPDLSTAIPATIEPSALLTATATAIAISVMLPVVAGDVPGPPPQPDSPLAPPVDPSLTTPPTSTVSLPSADDEPSPTPTVLVVLAETPTPTPPPLPPTPTPLPPTPSPTAGFTVGTLKAVVGAQNANVYIGPSSTYTKTEPSTIAPGVTVNLLGRDATGEWLYMCCVPNTNTVGWVRSARLTPVDNPTPANAPAGTDGNDIRYLAIAPLPGNLTPVATPTPIPPDDFPMYRRDSANSARVAGLPRLPMQMGWTVPGQAGGPFVSGAVVAGANVMAASNDNHIYSLDRQSGSQRWRYNANEPISASLAVDGRFIYAITPNGRVMALEDLGNQVQPRWEQSYSDQAQTGIISAYGRLFIAMRGDGQNHLLVLDNTSGAMLNDFDPLTGSLLLPPALGGQTVYVNGEYVWALDIFNFELLWQSNELVPHTSAPVYSSPGVRAAAELYVADTNGRVIAHDANTGRVIWASPSGQPMNALAVNNTLVIGVGGNIVRAFARNNGDQVWGPIQAPGTIVGSPIVDDTRVLVVTDAGALQMIDAASGSVQPVNVQVERLSGHVAVSGAYIFAPSAASAQMYAVQQIP